MQPTEPLLSVATLNIHKGFSQFNRQLLIHTQRQQLQNLGADLIFLQEVQGAHQKHAQRNPSWPSHPQHEYLAGVEFTSIYGKNATYQQGHHGNAILSRFPVIQAENQDISSHALERRGLLHCVVDFRGQELHCLNVHLALTARGRRLQLLLICQRIREFVPKNALLVLAGDFNDWRRESDQILAKELGVTEVFRALRVPTPRTFPALFPLLRLDRIYVRGLHVRTAEARFTWREPRLSDHGALTAQLALPTENVAIE